MEVRDDDFYISVKDFDAIMEAAGGTRVQLTKEKIESEFFEPYEFNEDSWGWDATGWTFDEDYFLNETNQEVLQAWMEAIENSITRLNLEGKVPKEYIREEEP